MKNAYSYTSSQLAPGEFELLREHSFTRWMSPDLLQPATDFLKNIGLVAIYAECSTGNLHRYLCWHPSRGCAFEIRSGRTFEQFEEFDQGNIARGWPLLSLHVNENKIHSAVWVSSDHAETAKKILSRYGIAPAVRTLVA